MFGADFELSIGWVDMIVMTIYFGGITLAGIWFSTRNKSTEDYFLGGRNFPGWAIGLSMVGTSISSISFLAYPGDAYKTAWLRLLPGLMLPFAVIIAAYVFLPFFRRGRITSAYEYLEMRFGPGTRSYAAAFFVIGQTFRIGMILYLLSLLVKQLTGLPVEYCIVLGGIFVAFYTVVGGIEAVVWTDVAQTIVLIFGGLFCFFIVWYNMPGGIGQIFEIAMEDRKFAIAETTIENGRTVVQPTRWDFSLFEKTALMMIWVGLANWLFEYSANQNVIQRYVASKSMKEARKAMLICVLACVPIWTFFMFLGTAFYSFFMVNPSPEALAILTGADNHKAEEILPFFATQFLPVGISGLVMAAVIAAAMSSLDSSINAIATVTTIDFYKRHWKKDMSDKHYLVAARVFATIAGVLMVVLALALARSTGTTFQDTATVVAAVTMGGLFGLFFLGFISTRGDGKAVGVGIFFTVAFTLIIVSVQLGWADPANWEGTPLGPIMKIDSYYTGFIGHILMFVIVFVVAALFQKKRDLPNLTIWTQDGNKID
jgi:SSS family solute:Na+ symporter